MYAKPSKMISNNVKSSLNTKNENQLNEELNAKQIQNLNSSESANSSLQNINTLDSGISICSTSTTQDLQCSNKTNELNKQNDELASSPSLDNGSVDNIENLKNNQLQQHKFSINQENDLQNSKENNQSNIPSANQLSNRQQNSQPLQKPLEYYEINADFNLTNRLNRNNALLADEYHPVVPKLKCYEISTEL